MDNSLDQHELNSFTTEQVENLSNLPLCAIPKPKEDLEGDGRWISMHNVHLTQLRDREPDVVMIGDSIIHHLQLRPVWRDWFEPFHCLNFGIPGDRTEHVLWRILNGELNNIEPKVCVILVGTNNTVTDDDANDVAVGIASVVNAARSALPEAYIIVIELLPRGQHDNLLREKNKCINEILRKMLANKPKIQLIGCDKGLIQLDGTISEMDMPDFLHLSDIGYRKAFEPLYDLLMQLIDEKELESLNNILLE